MLQLHIGGVPEHFNLPWHLLLESGELKQLDIAADWQDFPAGTGALVKAFGDDSLDIATLVTEGAVAAWQKPDCPFEIVCGYTTTPLLWGMHVPAHSKLHADTEFAGCRYAISRYGSGSHLMAIVHARSRGWQVEQMQFVLVENLNGARRAFRDSHADVFFWEHFTTKPYVDNGEFRWLGDFPSPWPGFMVCVRQQVWDQHSEQIKQLLLKVFNQAQQLKHSLEAVQVIAERYQLQVDDVHEWLSATEWAHTCELDEELLQQVGQTIG